MQPVSIYTITALAFWPRQLLIIIRTAIILSTRSRSNAR